MRRGRCTNYGFRAVIAPSFADIFFNNCFKNGLLPIMLPADDRGRVVSRGRGHAGLPTPDRPARTTDHDAPRASISGSGSIRSRKHSLVHGLDEIGQTLEHAAAIRAFEATHRERFPWLFA